MRVIVKRNEPTALAQHRSTPHSNYNNLLLSQKDAIRVALATEQRGLCCYCLSRIRARAAEMKIEHWHSQAHYPAEQLDYSNMLGACMGNETQPRIDQHCDTYKGDKNLSRNPAAPSHSVEDFIHYESTGRISSPDRAFDTELNLVLNLNVAFLINNRKAALVAFQQTLRKRGEIPQATWERWLRDWNGESNASDLRPFCNVIVYWIRKHLRR